MATRYWVGGDGDLSDTAHWSTASGGAGGASVPTISDTAVFNNLSSPTVGYTVTGSLDVGGLSMANPASGVLLFNGSFSVKQQAAGTTVTIGNVYYQGVLSFEPQVAGAHGLSLGCLPNPSGNGATVYLWSNTGTTITVSGTSSIYSLEHRSQVAGGGTLTFSSANITAQQYFYINYYNYATTTTLTTTTIKCDNVYFSGAYGSATITGTGSVLQNNSTYVSWSYANGNEWQFPGSFILNGGGYSVITFYPTGTITATDSNVYFNYIYFNPTLTSGAVSLTRSYLSTSTTDARFGAITLNTDPTTGSTFYAVGNGTLYCGAITVTAAATATSVFQTNCNVVSSGSASFTNADVSIINKITVSGTNTITVNNSATPTATLNWRGGIQAGSGTVSFTNVVRTDLYSFDSGGKQYVFNSTGAFNVNNSAILGTTVTGSGNGSNGTILKFASGTWNNLNADFSFNSAAVIQTTGAFTGTNLNPIKLQVGSVQTDTSSFGGAVAISTTGGCSLDSVTFSSTATFTDVSTSGYSSFSLGRVVATGLVTVNGFNYGGFGFSIGVPFTGGLAGHVLTGGLTMNATAYSECIVTIDDQFATGGSTLGTVTINTGLSSVGNSLILSGQLKTASGVTSTTTSGYANNTISTNCSITSGAVGLTNTNVIDANANSGWTSSGVFNSTTLPTTKSASISMGWLNAAGAISLTSTNVALQNQNPNAGAWLNTSLYGGSTLTVNGSALSGLCSTLTSIYNLIFGGAAVSIWTDVALTTGNSVTVNGAGAFSITNSASKSNSACSIGAVLGSSTTQMTFTVPSFNIGSLYVNTSTVAFIGTAFTSGANVNIGTDLNQTYGFGSNGTTTFTDIDALTIGGNSFLVTGSVTHTNTAARFTSSNQASFYISAPCVSTLGVANFAAFSITNSNVTVNQSGLNVSTLTMANWSTISCTGGLFTASSTVNAGTSGTYSSITSVSEINFAAATTLVNTTLIAPSMYVTGGSGKNFSYTYSSPVTKSNGNYLPEIQFDSFSLLNSGGTFAITSPTVSQRIFIRKYSTTTAGFATMSLATSATLTNVDFWRITPAGAAARPWTGTNLGRVGTLTDITTATPKNVYRKAGVNILSDSWSYDDWSLTSGGTTSPNNYPLPQDSVIFDSNSYPFSLASPNTLYVERNTRCKSITIDSAGTGTSTLSIATPRSTFGGSEIEFWLSGGLFGPTSTPTKTVKLFSNYQTDGAIPIRLVLADGTSTDSQAVTPQNIYLLDSSYLSFANAGSVGITQSITGPLYGLSQYTTGDYATRTVSFTCSSVNFGIANITIDAGTYNLGNVSFTGNATNCYIGYTNTTTIENTSYSITCASLYVSSYASATRLGSFNFVVPTYFFAPNSCSIQNDAAITLSNVTFTSSKTASLFNFKTSCSMYSLTVSYTSSMTFVADTFSSSGVTLTKVGGGTLGFNSGVAIGASGGKPVNASPASTWYAAGTVRNGSTGWNSGSAPTSKGGFLLFQ